VSVSEGVSAGVSKVINNLDECVERTIAAVGPHIGMGAPLGLGKPVQLMNAFYERVASDPGLSLHILTALSLEVPTPSSDIEASLAGPIMERLFGDYEELAFMAPFKRGELPDNIKVSELYFKAGAMKTHAEAQQRSSNIRFASAVMPGNAADTSPRPRSPGGLMSQPVQVVDVIGEGKSNPVVSMYAAGIAVMFLLFGATGGGGALLEERENQTLERLLATQLTMDQLLLGKWFHMTAIGTLQMLVMFAWAQLVFGVDLIGHLDGFMIMTLVTALAASCAFMMPVATPPNAIVFSSGRVSVGEMARAGLLVNLVAIVTLSALASWWVPRSLSALGGP